MNPDSSEERVSSGHQIDAIEGREPDTDNHVEPMRSHPQAAVTAAAELDREPEQVFNDGEDQSDFVGLLFHQHLAFFGALTSRRRKRLRTIRDSPQRAECICDDDYFLRNRDSVCNFIHHVGADHPCKRRRTYTHPVLVDDEKPQRVSFSMLPDDLLREVFRYLPRAQDRSMCASVSKQWLMIQSHMRRKDFHIRQQPIEPPKFSALDTVCKKVSRRKSTPRYVEDGIDADTRVERQPPWAIGDLSRSLVGKKATDIVLASIAVGTGDRGGLRKLSVKAGSQATTVTDAGLLAIGFSCTALQTLTLWGCPNITDEGLSVIGKGCRLLRTVDLSDCPLVGNHGLISIAKNSLFLSTLNLDECPLIGDPALNAVGKYCSTLVQLSIKNCRLVRDDGLEGILWNCKKLEKLKLHGLKVSNKLLTALGSHCEVLTRLCLNSLDLLTESGFSKLCKLCKLSSTKAFKWLSITNCSTFSDSNLVALAYTYHHLRQISITKCEKISDQGLSYFVRLAASLKILHIEECDRITMLGLTCTLSSTTGKLKEIHFKKCNRIQNQIVGSSPVLEQSNSMVKNLSLANCAGVGDGCLSRMGLFCNQITDLDLTGLASISDGGLLALFRCGRNKFTSLNITGCEKLTDLAVGTIAEQCGRSLRSLILDGCNMVTDMGLLAIGKHCILLEGLGISQCSISDVGVRSIVSAAGLTLSSLNMSGCGGITDKSLHIIEEGCQDLKELNVKYCRGLTQKMLDGFAARGSKCDILCVF